MIASHHVFMTGYDITYQINEESPLFAEICTLARNCLAPNPSARPDVSKIISTLECMCDSSAASSPYSSCAPTIAPPAALSFTPTVFPSSVISLQELYSPAHSPALPRQPSGGIGFATGGAEPMQTPVCAKCNCYCFDMLYVTLLPRFVVISVRCRQCPLVSPYGMGQ
jgi:hypothetical protein